MIDEILCAISVLCAPSIARSMLTAPKFSILQLFYAFAFFCIFVHVPYHYYRGDAKFSKKLATVRFVAIFVLLVADLMTSSDIPVVIIIGGFVEISSLLVWVFVGARILSITMGGRNGKQE